MRAILPLFALLLLSACVSDQLNSGFDRMRNQPLSVAMDRLGVPSSERMIAGRHIYTWTHTELISTFQPSSSFTTAKGSGKSGDSKYTASTFGGSTVQTSATCKIEAEVDGQGNIRNLSYDGPVAACGKYAQAMNR